MLIRSQIQSRIPHAGTMCLLDFVRRWDATTIICEAAAPTAAHPLAQTAGSQGVPAVAAVAAVVAVEYAAQAAAVHGSLLDDTDSPRDGLLAKLTDVELRAAGLDEVGGQLTIRAQLLSRVASGCIYSFDVSDQRGCVARGRLLVAFQA